jgi:hypothetical protein
LFKIAHWLPIHEEKQIKTAAPAIMNHMSLSVLLCPTDVLRDLQNALIRQML